MIKVTFHLGNGQNIIAETSEGTENGSRRESLLTIAKRSGVSIDAPCNGNGTCGKCKVRIASGEVESQISRHLSEEEYADGWRLACDTIPVSDVEVEVPSTASDFKTGIKTADLNDPKTVKVFEDAYQLLSADGIMDEKAVFTRVYELEAPTLEDTVADNDRLMMAVAAEFGCEAELTFTALKKLAWVLRDNAFRVRVVLTKQGEKIRIMDVLAPEGSTQVCGIAIDIGTTTVTGVMVDMENGKILSRASAGNGQIAYGADVINRIIESTRPGGSDRLQKAIIEQTLLPLIGQMCEQAQVAKEHIYRIAIAGNTTMEHLLLSLHSDPIRMEPYIPSFFRIGGIPANEILPGINAAAEVLLAPNVGSYVGGDITAGILSSHMWKESETTLFIDLGTNGEIVVGNEEYLMTCACSAGPAFEGGEMSCGMRATDGAIDSITIDKETMEPHFTVIGEEGQTPIGICGSGIIDAVAQMLLTGIIGANGRIKREGDRIVRDEHNMARYILVKEEESPLGREVSINEVDIDNFMRAKAAIFSAVVLMTGQLGLEVSDIEHIQIAGGIGSGIDFRNAVIIGMFPDVPLEKFSYIGNSSLSGAYAMLLSKDAEEKINEIASGMMYVELSSEPGYMDEFVAACFMPHTDDSLFPSVVIG